MKESFKQRAVENLEAAELLYEKCKYNASANRAYYAVFHLAIALLFAKGYNPIIDHRNTLSLFCNEFVNKKKLFPSEVKKVFYELQASRNQADYGVGINKNTANHRLVNMRIFFEYLNPEL